MLVYCCSPREERERGKARGDRVGSLEGGGRDRVRVVADGGSEAEYPTVWKERRRCARGQGAVALCWSAHSGSPSPFSLISSVVDYTSSTPRCRGSWYNSLHQPLLHLLLPTLPPLLQLKQLNRDGNSWVKVGSLLCTLYRYYAARSLSPTALSPPPISSTSNPASPPSLSATPRLAAALDNVVQCPDCTKPILESAMSEHARTFPHPSLVACQESGASMSELTSRRVTCTQSTAPRFATDSRRRH